MSKALQSANHKTFSRWSVLKKKVLFTDHSNMPILTHYSPRSNILVSLMCNAKIVKHALISSHILYIPLDANGSGQGSCCFWCAAAVCLSRDQSPVLIPDLQHTT